MKENEVISAEEACEFLRIAKPTLYRYVRRGIIPAFRIGNKVLRFHKTSLEQWVAAKVATDTKASASRSTSSSSA